MFYPSVGSKLSKCEASLQRGRPLVAGRGTAAPGIHTVQSVKKKKRNSEGITYYFKLFLDARDQIPLKPR